MKTAYAIEFVLGPHTRTLAVNADDASDAYYVARDLLQRLHLVSASLQGACRIATDADIAASLDNLARIQALAY
jgi:hypothetical protein